MTARKSSRQSRARSRARAATPVAAPVVAGETQAELMERLRRMADEVEHLQTEIAAVEAFVTDPNPVPVVAPLAAVRPGSSWTPTPTPQPWLVPRSA